MQRNTVTFALRRDVFIQDRGAVKTFFVRPKDAYVVKQVLREEGFTKIQTKPSSREFLPLFVADRRAKQLLLLLRSKGEQNMIVKPKKAEPATATQSDLLRQRAAELFLPEAAEKWWRTPSPYFEGHSPEELVATDNPQNVQRVVNALMRLEEGIYV